jgi:hypothetical protein
VGPDVSDSNRVSGQAYIIEKEGYLIAYRDIDPVLKREKLTHLKVVQNFINNGFESDEAHTEISTGILGVKAITTHVNLRHSIGRLLWSFR